MKFFQNNLKEIVYGGSDGIVTTFAVVSGFAGAGGVDVGTHGFFLVILFGFANLFGDATSMGLGDFLSSLSQRDVSLKAKKNIDDDLENNIKKLVIETEKLLVSEGMSENDAKVQMTIFERNHELWKNYLMKSKYDISREMKENPAISSLATFSSFIIFGLIPLLPFVFMKGELSQLFGFSLGAAGVALLLLGVLRWRVTGSNLIRSALEALFIGGTASGVAYLVGVYLGK